MGFKYNLVLIGAILVLSLAAVGFVATEGAIDRSGATQIDSTSDGFSSETTENSLGGTDDSEKAAVSAVITADEDDKNDTGGVTIDGAVQKQANENEIVTVVVRFAGDDTHAGSQSAETHTEELKIRASQSQTPFERFVEGHPGVEIDRQLWLVNANVVTVDTSKVPVEKLGTVENVERIHENFAVEVAESTTVKTGAGPASVPHTGQHETISASTDGTDFTNALEHINVPAVWEQYQGRGAGVRVAVVDTGVNTSHPDIELVDEEEGWACFVECDDNPDGPHDVNGHGTHVSGTIAGTDSTGVQIGVAPETEMLHAKGLNDTGTGSFESIIDSMQWSVENNADVLSMSLGVAGKWDQFVDPIRNAQASGTIVVAAIGNDGAGISGSPANVYDALSVGSVEVVTRSDYWVLEDDRVSDFSGGELIDSKDDWSDAPDEWPDEYPVPDLVAPGEFISSADNEDDSLTWKAGTSMATPHVSGVIALMLSNTGQELSPGEIQGILEDTSVDIGEDATRMGEGRIDALAAVDATVIEEFSVTALAPDDPVTEGEPLNVSVTVENTGETETARQIKLDVDTNQDGNFDEITADSGVLTLEQGQTKTIQLTYGSQIGDKPAVNVRATTESDSMTATARVEEAPGAFSGTVSDGTEDPVEATAVTFSDTAGGFEKTVETGSDGSYTVEDVAPDTYNITALADGFENDTKTAVDIDAAETTQNVNFTVLEIGDLIVSIDEEASELEVMEHESFAIRADVTNTGQTTLTHNITATVADTQRDVEQDVTVSGGETESVTLSFTAEADFDDKDVVVSSQNQSTNATLTVLRKANFEVSAVDVRDTDVVESQKLAVAVTVENTGDVADSQNVSLAVDGAQDGSFETVANESVSLAGNESETVTLTYDSEIGDAPDVGLRMATENDSVTETAVLSGAEANLTFDEQATASSTMHGSVTAAGVVIEDIETNVDTVVVVTRDNGDNLVIAGLESFTADELDGANATIAVENTSGLPGNYTAHAIPADVFDQSYSAGDVLSEETGDWILAGDIATVFQGTVEIPDQNYLGSTTELTIDTSDLQPEAQSEYAIVVHETDGEEAGDVVGMATGLDGNEQNVSVTLEEERQETGSFVATLYFPNDPVGPAIPNADAQDGFVDGNVSDTAVVDVLDADTADVKLSVAVEPAVTQAASTTLEGVDGELTARVTADGEPVSGVSVDVEAILGKGTITAGTTAVETGYDGLAVFDDLVIDEPDDYQLAFSISETTDDVDNATIETSLFEVEPLPLAKYANDKNGLVETAGLRNAIEDWVGSDIDTGLLRDVIQAWVTGDPVV